MPTEFKFFDFHLTSEIDLLYRGDEVVPLEPRAVQLLRYLVERAGRVVSKRDLLESIWVGTFTTDGVLKRAVFHCRQALGDDSHSPQFIETLHGRGYRFLPEVEVVELSKEAQQTVDHSAAVRVLPASTSTFIGRTETLALIGELLEHSRCVCLAGPGGMGKTRLALEYAERARLHYPHGVRFVGFESLTDPALVPARIAQSIGIQESADRTLVRAIIDHIANHTALIVFDNCEHLLDACAEMTSCILKGAATVSILATSREPLGIEGEAVCRVQSLTLPDIADSPGLDRVSSSEAAQLFLDRARLIAPDFEIVEANCDAVAKICTSLDGIPLAIELAAARVASLTVEEIAARLDDVFKLLTRGDRTAPARRQTMRAAVDWSYDLLTESEQKLLRALSVFQGFDLDAAEAIAGASTDAVLDNLTRLVDKSLVVAERHGGRMRYRILDTIRKYALEKLVEHTEEAAYRAAQASWMLDLAANAERSSRGPEEKRWVGRIAAEHDNARTVLEWIHATASDPHMLAELCSGLMRFWDLRGFWTEGRKWMDAALSFESEITPHLSAKVHFGAGMLARHQADSKRAEQHLVASLQMFRDVSDQRAVAQGLNALGNLYESQGHYAQAVDAQAESLAIYEQLNDDKGRVMAHSGLGMLALDAQDYGQAERHYLRALDVSRRIGDDAGAGIALHNLGDIMFRLRRLDQAREYLMQSLELAGQLGYKSLSAHNFALLGEISLADGDLPVARSYYLQTIDLARELSDAARIAYAFDGLAQYLSVRGDVKAALLLAGSAARIREELGVQCNVDEEVGPRGMLDRAQIELGDLTVRELLDRGRRLSISETVDLVQESEP